MDVSHGAGLVLVRVGGGWKVCWMTWLSWEWQCWDLYEVTNETDFFQVLVENRVSVSSPFRSKFSFSLPKAFTSPSISAYSQLLPRH